MNLFLKGVAQAITETFHLPTPILEVGSYQVPGQEQLADLRSFFPNQPYTGIDIREGPGVDQVASVEALPFSDNTFGTVIAMSTFEHVRKFWLGFAEVNRVLKPEGVLIVSCPFNVRIHNHPNDYWRFTPEALDVLLEDYPQKIVGWHGPEEKPENVWAIAFGAAHAEISDDQYVQYRELVSRYARQPLPWRRKLRYRLINMVDRKRICSAYLEAENWQSAKK